MSLKKVVFPGSRFLEGRTPCVVKTRFWKMKLKNISIHRCSVLSIITPTFCNFIWVWRRVREVYIKCTIIYTIHVIWYYCIPSIWNVNFVIYVKKNISTAKNNLPRMLYVEIVYSESVCWETLRINSKSGCQVLFTILRIHTSFIRFTFCFE